MGMKNDWTYVALCLVVPLLWGVIASRIFDWWQARLRRNAPPATDEGEGLEYYI